MVAISLFLCTKKQGDRRCSLNQADAWSPSYTKTTDQGIVAGRSFVYQQLCVSAFLTRWEEGKGAWASFVHPPKKKKTTPFDLFKWCALLMLDWHSRDLYEKWVQVDLLELKNCFSKMFLPVWSHYRLLLLQCEEDRKGFLLQPR